MFQLWIPIELVANINNVIVASIDSINMVIFEFEIFDCIT